MFSIHSAGTCHYYPHASVKDKGTKHLLITAPDTEKANTYLMECAAGQ